MTDKELMEYSQWMWADMAKHVVQSVAIYAVLLIAYWGFVA